MYRLREDAGAEGVSRVWALAQVAVHGSVTWDMSWLLEILKARSYCDILVMNNGHFCYFATCIFAA